MWWYTKALLWSVSPGLASIVLDVYMHVICWHLIRYIYAAQFGAALLMAKYLLPDGHIWEVLVVHYSCIYVGCSDLCWWVLCMWFTFSRDNVCLIVVKGYAKWFAGGSNLWVCTSFACVCCCLSYVTGMVLANCIQSWSTMVLPVHRWFWYMCISESMACAYNYVMTHMSVWPSGDMPWIWILGLGSMRMGLYLWSTSIWFMLCSCMNDMLL